MKRSYTLIALAALMLTVSIIAPANGQSTQATELKRRILEQVRTGAVRTAPVPVPQQRLQLPFDVPKNSLTGTWDLILTFPDNSQVHSTLQVAPGFYEGEGSATHASEFSLAPPSPTLPEQGSWSYFRKNQFNASYYGYSFDEQLQPFGKIGFRHVISMDRDLDHFTGQAVFEVIDLEGNVVFSDTLVTAGVRQRPRP